MSKGSRQTTRWLLATLALTALTLILPAAGSLAAAGERLQEGGVSGDQAPVLIARGLVVDPHGGDLIGTAG